MKTKNLLIGVAVLAIIVAGGGYVAVGQMEKKVEDNFRQYIENQPAPTKATLGKVSYGYFSNTLSVEKLDMTTTYQGMDVQATVDSMSMEGYNPATLDPKAPKGEKFASHFEVNNAKMVFKDKTNVKIEMTIESFFVEDFAMNAARMITAYTQDPMGQAYFEEALNISFTNSAVKNVDMYAYQDDNKILGMHIGTSGITDYIGTTANNFVNDFALSIFNPELMGAFSFARMDIQGMTYPSAEQLSKFSQLSTQMNQDPEELSQAMLEWYKEIYLQQPFYKSLTMQDIMISSNGKPVENPQKLMDYHGTDYKTNFKMESLESTFDYSNPLLSRLKLNNMSIDKNMLADTFLEEMYVTDEKVEAAIRSMLPETPTWSVDLDVKLGFKGQPSDIRADLTMPSMGALSLNIAATLPCEDLSALVNDKNYTWLEAPVSKVTLVYKDLGLLPLFILANAPDTMSPSEFMDDLREDADHARQDEQMGPYVDDILAFVEKPGTVSLSAENLEGVTLLESAFVFMLMDPQALGLKVQVEQGPKTLLEYYPENIR